jgi:hypothetical protein
MWSRRNLTLGVVWLTMCGAAFISVFSVDDAQSVLPFVIALLVLQAPAFLAVVDAPHGRPLEAGRAITTGFMGGLAGMYILYALCESLAPDQFGLMVGSVGFLVLTLVLSLGLALLPHPLAGKLLFTGMLAISLVAAVAMVTAGNLERTFFIAVSCAIPWPLPLVVLCWWPTPSVAPVMQVVR